MHNFHEVNGSFPTGGNSSGGAGWATYILPFMEYGSVFDQLHITERFYSPSDAFLHNYTFLDNLVVENFVCPSSPLRRLIAREDAVSNGRRMQGANYFGVMGATLNFDDPTDPSGKNRTCDCTPPQHACSHGGYVAANGTFYPHSRTRIRDIFDGSSNTMIIGEQSDVGFSPGGICPDPWDHVGETEIRASKRMGIWAGFAFSTDAPEEWINSGCSCSTNREGGTSSTLRWPINTKVRKSAFDGMGNYAFNHPFQSAHPGGINVLFGDGSARFLSESTDRPTLNWLCIRDDGQPIGLLP